MTGTAVDRGAGVRRHLQDGRGRDPHQPAGGRGSTTTTRSIAPSAEKNRAIIDPDRGLLQARPADPGRHRLDREVRDRCRSCWPSTASNRTARRKVGIPHQVLNARYHEQEAFIVADAGVPGAVTIATNMAGRGTDIQLGGNIDMRVDRWRQEQRGLGIEVTPERGATSARTSSRPRSPSKRPRRWPRAGSMCWAPSGTRAGGSTTSCAAAPAARATPGARSSSCPARTTCCASSPATGWTSIMRTFGVQEGEAITHKWLNSGHRHRPAAGRAAQLRDPQEPAEVRRRGQRPAQGRVRAAPGVHGGRGPVRDRRRDAPRHHQRHGRAPPAAQGLRRTVGHRGPGRAAQGHRWAWSCRSPTGPARTASATRRSNGGSTPPPTRAPPSARRMHRVRPDPRGGEELPAADDRPAVARAPDAPRPPAATSSACAATASAIR